MVAALIPHFLAAFARGASAHAPERRAPEFASIIEHCPGILQGFPGSSERSPPLDWICVRSVLQDRRKRIRLGTASMSCSVLIPMQRHTKVLR